VRELGQPSVQIDVDREKIARYGINVSDVEGVIEGRRGARRPHKSFRASGCLTWSCA